MVAGSTRMKAALAQKMVLHMISTGAMSDGASAGELGVNLGHPARYEAHAEGVHHDVMVARVPKISFA